jgi:biopolymer transport protein ExbB/TolQ
MFGLSVWSVSIMIERRKFFFGETPKDSSLKIRGLLTKRDWQGLSQLVSQNQNLVSSSLQVMLQVYQKNKTSSHLVEAIDRSYRSHVNSQKLKIEKGLSNLATLGANAPFIGLFGTVLGIIQAFAALGFESTGTGAVMAGISRSLIATAAGLFVAIPAVIAFNYFTKKTKEIFSENDSLKDLFISYIITEPNHGGGK